MPNLTSDTVLTLASNIVTRKEENSKYVVYNPATDELHVLSRLAYTILKLCEQPARVAEITGLVEESIPAFQCDQGRGEVNGLLQKLLKRGLLQAA
ncbi:MULTISPECIES: PqqD family protein [Paenibacillus]|jgi:hypothetical protein|uniref:Uncharacterized protein n=1 Tax=Paenibacillus borealis TaxID=160799 RepID=A0ABX3GZQ4_PAEBO|nr:MULTISPECIES: PqqD family protein [Paenibacillus]AIQ21252.1 hypothetical protein H70357_34620 [Paenibacillus sp. FSL H7-0357]OMD40843.1 hypothetical protein BSK56_28220 [Paenibacillus borealis]